MNVKKENKRKRFFILFVLFVIVFVSFSITAIHSLAEERTSERRNVTLIYDDSGSMWYFDDPETNQRVASDHWKFANYALQGLTSLLGENDTLNVVRMSDEYNVEQIGLEYTNRQQEINRISSWTESGWTPFQTVHTSIETMLDNMEEYPDEEYWFIIVMDGAFNDLDSIAVTNPEQLEANYQLAHDTLLDFKHKVEEQGISFQSLFVTLEAFLTDEEREKMTRFTEEVWKPTLAGQHLKAETEQEVIDRIIDVAALITNRDPNSSDAETLFTPDVNGNTVTLDSPYPLKRITVIQQQSGREVTHEITEISLGNQAENFIVNGPFFIESPFDSRQLRETTYGAVSHINHGDADRVIPAGTYSIVFADDVNLEELQFIAEPAIDFTMNVKRELAEGDYTEESTEFYVGSTMNLVVRLTERREDGEAFSFDPQEALSELDVTAIIDDREYPLSWDQDEQAFTATFTMPAEETTAVVTANIPGFYQETKEFRIVGAPARTWELTSTTTNWTSHMRDLDEASPLRFTPYINGEMITEQELASYFEYFQATSDGENVAVEIIQDGSDILLYVLEADAGEWNVTVTFDHPNEGVTFTTQEQITVTGSSGIPTASSPSTAESNIILYFIGFIVLVYLVGVLLKKRFAGNGFIVAARSQTIYDRKHTIAERNVPLKSSFLKRWFVPFVSEKKKVGSLVFKASSKKDNILLAKENQEAEIKIADSPLGDAAGAKDYPVPMGEVISKQVGYVEETYVYKRSTEKNE